MPNPEEVEPIRAYLEQHRATYERTALRERLLADGHTPEAVDLAMAQVYGLQVAPAAPQPVASSTGQVVAIAIVVFLLNYLVLPLIFYLLSVVLPNDTGILVGFILIPVALIGEGVGALVMRSRNRAWSRGLAWGAGLSLLPVAALAILFGICVAIFSGSF